MENQHDDETGDDEMKLLKLDHAKLVRHDKQDDVGPAAISYDAVESVLGPHELCLSPGWVQITTLSGDRWLAELDFSVVVAMLGQRV